MKCKDCKIDKNETEFYKHRNGYKTRCKVCYNLMCSEYRSNNKDKKKLWQKENRWKYKHLDKKSRTKYRLDRKNDENFIIKEKIRSLIKDAFRRQGYDKTSRTQEILGCSYEEFKIYLESKFEPWMNWENKGLYNGSFNYGWDIDHIIPISSATNEEELIKLNHYTNLQPLCSKVNRDIKKDKIEWL